MEKVITNVNKGNIDIFKERLKEARLNSSLKSKDALAKAVGVNRATINNYETGDRKPDIDRFIDLADVLNVSYDYLLGYSNSTIREYHDTKEMTGLSDKAIEVLNTFVKESKNEMGLKEIYIDILKTISYLIEKEEEYHILEKISNLFWRTYRTDDIFGEKFVEIEDKDGQINVFPVSDLYNAEVLQIIRQLIALKENKGTEEKKKK